MSKHTPGPWRVSLLEIKSKGETRMVMGADDFSVVWVGERTAEENHANALLIAAAPDLLEACKRLVEISASCDPECTPEECAWAAARSAIAKARGERQ